MAPVSSADHSAQAAMTKKRVMTASGSLLRKIAVTMGVKPRAPAASTAARSPVHRRTRWNVTSTATTPARAMGASMVTLEKPKIRPEISMTHREAGGLSTVMNEDGSSEPKKKAFQLSVPLFTAAA